jgi:hypothetical protein
MFFVTVTVLGIAAFLAKYFGVDISSTVKHLTAKLPFAWLKDIAFWSAIIATVLFALGTGWPYVGPECYGFGLMAMIVAILSSWASGYHTARDEVLPREV